MKDKILNWFATGRVGLSSKAMACAIAQIDNKSNDYPHDPDDLNRCLLFLEAVPEARAHFDKVAALSPYWKALIERFDEIESTFLQEVGLNWCHGKRATKTYKLMRSILDPITEQDSRAIRVGNATLSF